MIRTALFLRIFCALCFSFALGQTFRRAWSIEHGREYAPDRVWGEEEGKMRSIFSHAFRRLARERSERALPCEKNKKKNRDRATNVVTSTLLFPTGIALIFAKFVWTEGWRHAPGSLFRFASDLMLTMSVYYLAMLLLMPMLRRHISARACATAWLLPTFLYYVVFLIHSPPMPRVVFYCPARLIDLLVPVWFTGFALVLTWFVVSHLRFRRHILREAFDEEDEAVLAVWRQEMQALNLKTPIRLIRCKSVATPFSMAGIRGTLFTALPIRAYTEAELRLVFRHELHHIQRSDIASKFFFAFLCSLFWFHPLMWVAARESAKDLELSCDEIVLDGEQGAGRRLYAELLLHTAGEPRGFTTCLSADAAALRYRLRHVMQEQSVPLGTGLLTVLLTICVLCHGIFAFSDERYPLGELFVDAGAIDHFSCEIYDRNEGTWQYLSDADLKEGTGEELLAYLSSLSVERLIGSVNRTDDPEHSPRLYISDSQGSLQGFWLYDGYVSVYDWYQSDKSIRHRTYYVRDKIDWEKIRSYYEEEGKCKAFSLMPSDDLPASKAIGRYLAGGRRFYI